MQRDPCIDESRDGVDGIKVRQTHGNERADDSDRFRVYDLVECRKHRSREPAAHQWRALHNLDQWYDRHRSQYAGGVLVLPTGGGKTFTAANFLCRRPLSDGHKVLWLAHTGFLIEQAFDGFGHVLGGIAEPKAELSIRVVSGAVGHFKVADVETSDDVIVATVQTIWNGLENEHPCIDEWLKAAGDKLVVVVDEAHHSPAPTYRELVRKLRERFQHLCVLGLTATPTYTDETKRGWLSKLFPEGILFQVDVNELIAAGVLSKPILEDVRTDVDAEFDEREFKKWVGTHRDLPESIISNLAKSQERNDLIVAYYLARRERFGKTIIFADRWHQCEYLCEALKSRGVRADAVYSHVGYGPGSAEERNRRTADENARVLHQFRKNELDVLINVRMLTEGTDVPDVKTVFLTRQTTSQILLTQMVGRALRGPAFNGTAEAYIVSFIDDWRERINWAAYSQLADTGADDAIPMYGKRPPVDLISIELVKRLARQMDSGVNIATGPFLALMPVGWYRVDYHVQVEGREEIEEVSKLVLVFEHEEESYSAFLGELEIDSAALDSFLPEDARRRGGIDSKLGSWREKHFPNAADHIGSDLLDDLFDLTKHMAEHERRRPAFFRFETREEHNLDKIARGFIDRDLGDRTKNDALKIEFSRHDRFWNVLYHRFDQFKSQFDGVVNRILNADSEPCVPAVKSTQTPPPREPPEQVKQRVLVRDRKRCLCCRSDFRLQTDHINATYWSSDHSDDNLQTLCIICNGEKGTRKIDFRQRRTPLSQASTNLRCLAAPSSVDGGIGRWEEYLRRIINFFFECSAVDSVAIGDDEPVWSVSLHPHVDSNWLAPHFEQLASHIRESRLRAALSPVPERIELKRFPTPEPAVPTQYESRAARPSPPNAVGTSHAPSGKRDSSELPPALDFDEDDVMAAFRNACWNVEYLDEEELLREVAKVFDYKRLGKNIRASLLPYLKKAKKRFIVARGVEGYYCPTKIIRNYEDDELIGVLRSVMHKGQDLERDEVIRRVVRHLGYANPTEAIRDRMKSIFNMAIRRGVLDKEGNTVWRA